MGFPRSVWHPFFRIGKKGTYVAKQAVLAYEFITGGGWFSLGESQPPAGSLLREGLAMLRAVLDDLAGLPELEVHYLRDARLPEIKIAGAIEHVVASSDDEMAVFRETARRCQECLVIAPEFGGLLASRAEIVERIPARLLSPASSFVTVAADKHALAERLKRFGVRTPNGILVRVGEPLPREMQFPAVLKPNDGAGSQATCRIDDPQSAAEVQPVTRLMRLENYCEGTPCSVSVICGGRRRWALPAFEQLLSDEGDFRYLGGRRMMNEPLVMRAQRLALNALAAMPAATGYVGVDMVLGDRADGSRDVVIEINPRLTTSYVGLRALAKTNLAEAMWRVAHDQSPRLGFRDAFVEFTADGQLL